MVTPRISSTLTEPSRCSLGGPGLPGSHVTSSTGFNPEELTGDSSSGRTFLSILCAENTTCAGTWDASPKKENVNDSFFICEVKPMGRHFLLYTQGSKIMLFQQKELASCQLFSSGHTAAYLCMKCHCLQVNLDISRSV